MNGGSGAPWRVVLVGDDEAIRDLLEMILDLDPRFEMAGTAGSGTEAVVLAQAVRPAVVVLDLQTTDLDGPAVLAQLRHDLPETRVVVLSAYPDLFTLVEVVSLGADSYLDEANAFAELIPTLLATCTAVETYEPVRNCA